MPLEQLEAKVRAAIYELDPSVGFTDPQIAAIVTVIKKVLDTERATLPN